MVILKKTELQNKTCYLMGDFNLNLLKYEVNQHSNVFLNNIFSSSFYPLITKPNKNNKIKCNSY